VTITVTILGFSEELSVGWVVLDGVETGVCVVDVSVDVGAELLADAEGRVGAGAGVGSAMVAVATFVTVGAVAVTSTVLVLVFSSTTVVVSEGGADVEPPSTLTIEYDLARGAIARGFDAPSRGKALEKVERQSITAR
jgi:hypothetical protein